MTDCFCNHQFKSQTGYANITDNFDQRIICILPWPKVHTLMTVLLDIDSDVTQVN